MSGNRNQPPNTKPHVLEPHVRTHTPRPGVPSDTNSGALIPSSLKSSEPGGQLLSQLPLPRNINFGSQDAISYTPRLRM